MIDSMRGILHYQYHVTGSYFFNHSEHSTASPYVTEFEDRMRDYFGRDVVAVNSGTSALFLAILTFSYDSIVLPAITFISTANAAKMAGKSIFFEDVDLETWCSKRCLYKHTTQIPVDLYGVISSGERDIRDACESFGIVQRGIGLCCYSFNGNKIITTGAGGLIVGDNLDRIRTLASVGRNENWEYVEAGFNMRMAGINAKLGLQEFGHLEERLAWQKRVNDVYRNELPFKFQEAGPLGSTWWYTACLLPDGMGVVQTINMLNSCNIYYGMKPARRVFRPLNQELPYRDGKSYPVAEYIYEHGICLPQPTNEKDLMVVCSEIKQSL